MGAEVMPMTTGFPPIAGPGATVLVLGTLPSRKSLERQQYYGHPQNAFWRIMNDLFGAAVSMPYGERKQVLTRNGVAVWDVLAASVRPGSLDASIDHKTATPNDFRSFFANQAGLRLVCFNGRAAESLFGRLVAPTLEKGSNSPVFHTLPSTSPAHAAMRYEDKLARWQVIKSGTEITGENK